MVPTMINALVNYPGIREYDLTSMVTIPFGASPMPDAVLAHAREVMPWCTFMHVYGMT
jgi:acyl-CoA synthetase (AMP-forming)/AMP-acid ligase II